MKKVLSLLTLLCLMTSAFGLEIDKDKVYVISNRNDNSLYVKDTGAEILGMSSQIDNTAYWQFIPTENANCYYVKNLKSGRYVQACDANAEVNVLLGAEPVEYSILYCEAEGEDCFGFTSTNLSVTDFTEGCIGWNWKDDNTVQTFAAVSGTNHRSFWKLTEATVPECFPNHTYGANGICTIEGCTDKYQPAEMVDGVYQLTNAGNVEWMSAKIAAAAKNEKGTAYNVCSYVMTNDIDFTGVPHEPIGPNDAQKFNGVFDGQFHRITNLHATGTNTGFFGWVRGGSTIKNLIIDATCSFEATERCGSLIAITQTSEGGTVSIFNVVNFASVTSGTKVAAGILAAGAPNNNHPVVNMANCVNAGIVQSTGGDKAAGLLGWNKSGSISTLKACYNIGECSPLDGANNLFRGNNRALPNSYDLVNTTAQGKSGTQGLKDDWITADPVHSGELCYVLNNGEMSANGVQYTQDLSDPNSIPLPVPGKTVYQVADLYCNGTPKGSVTYSNTEGGSKDDHNFDPETGLCTICSFPDEEWKTAKDDGFYYLSNATEVEWFSHMVRDAGHGAMKARLTADIDFGGVADAHLPIGSSAHKFFGHFDGQGHRIIGMVLTTASKLNDRVSDGNGFFGSVRGGGTDANGTVTNEVIIENLIIDASCSIEHDNNFAAGVVAHINSRNDETSNIIIRNCGNEANVSTTGKQAAGILGCVEATNVGLKLYNLWNTGNISGKMGESAAICAWTGQRNVNGEVDVEGCWNIGEVEGIDANGYNLIRRNTNIVPRNIVDLCTTNAGNQGKVAVLNTEDPISSGELCYLLNGDQSKIVYTQTLGTDEMPVYGTTSKQVYQSGTINCLGAAVGTVNYNNESGETTVLDHNINDEIGMCDVCHTQFQAPDLVDGYYEIKNAGHLEWFSHKVDEGGDANLQINGKLMNDIDMLGIKNLHLPIGVSTAKKYNGTFDGQGFRIMNMIIERPSDSNIGFFGFLRGNAANTTVKNLIIDKSCTIHGYNRVGGITGSCQNNGTLITLENIINEATVIAEHQDAAGIIGGQEGNGPKWLIRNVLNTGTITAKNEAPYAGALCCFLGGNNESIIENFVNLGTINGHRGGNIGRIAGKYTNIIDLSDTDFESSLETNYGHETGLEKEDIANGKLAYVVGWGQLIGTDEQPSPLNEDEVNYVGEAGYATFYDAAKDWELNGDAQAYIGTINGSWVKLTEIDDIPAGTAVVLKGSYYNKLATTATSDVTGNEFKGTAADTEADGTMYILAKNEDEVGFFKAEEGTTIAAGKAYLQPGTNAVKGYLIDINDATGIEKVEGENNAPATIFDLSGRRVQKVQKGIYIVNGKKIAVK